VTEILVVDDDRKTVDLIALYLRRAGFEVRVAHDGQRALELVRERTPDLLVLDLMLPLIDGLDVCEQVQGVATLPVIMLTARTTEDDKLVGLETGADDYVTKPFSPRELVARVKAVLRRTRPADATPREVRSGDLVVDLDRPEARLRGEPLALTPKELRVLQVLAREPGRAWTRAGLLERAFGFDYDVLERTIDVHVANLRKKIEPDPARPRYVVTVQGHGYKFVVEDAHAAVDP
jgi:DNA-binding response OmpR family regulator